MLYFVSTINVFFFILYSYLINQNALGITIIIYDDQFVNFYTVMG